MEPCIIIYHLSIQHGFHQSEKKLLINNITTQKADINNINKVVA